MRKVYLALLALSCLLPARLAAAETNQIMTISVDQIHAGMRGVAYTVFAGTQPEAMEVEVLGVLRDMNGPKSDLILIRLHGTKVEYTGVVAGMSGSPVYLEGKLAGALSYRIGEFSKEPIAGVTPIGEMLEINALDRTAEAATATAKGTTSLSNKTSGPGEPSPFAAFDYASLMKPIAAPLVFSGFSEDTVHRFASKFASAGVVPVMGAGSVSTDVKQPEAIKPGSSVSAILVRGDMGIAATCTVTYVDPQRLLACGHPLLQYGMVDMPMTKADVLATLPSPANAFKIVNATEPIGSFVQDRHTGIMGLFGKDPQMIPVTLKVHGGPSDKTFHYEVLNNARLSPVAMMATVFNALRGMNEYGEEITYRMNGEIKVNGYPKVTLQNMYAPIDGSSPAAMLAALSVGDRFSRIFDNPYEQPTVKGVQLDFDLVKERRWARLENVRTDVTEARPGDDITVEAVLRPYRGEGIVKQIKMHVPTSVSRGPLHILVSDGSTLDQFRRGGPALARKLDLASTIAMLNKEHSNNSLYVSLLEADPEAMVADKVMPTLPLSVMNVMEGMRGTQEMVVLGESSVDEASTPLDYVVSGAQLLTINIK